MSYSRDHFRHHEVTLQDVAARAPWRALPVAGLEPITIPVGGPTIRLSCAELAAYAGLEVASPRLCWPEPGQLAGCVAIASTFASALVPSAECVIDRLYSHRLMSLQFRSGDRLDLWAGKPGTVRLWLCVAVEGPQGGNTASCLAVDQRRRRCAPRLNPACVDHHPQRPCGRLGAWTKRNFWARSKT